jgi:HlyD family secretion protein
VDKLAEPPFRRPPVVPQLRPAGGRLPVRFVSVVLGAALICALTSALGVSDGGLLIVREYAQSKHQNPIESARKTIDTLINRLRGRDMPDGIVKTNGRIEATEVDIAAKYPGRLVKLTVDEGR